MWRKLLVVFALASLAPVGSACMLEEDTLTPPSQPRDPGTPLPPPQLGPRAMGGQDGGVGVGATPSLEIGRVPEVTYWDAIPVRGVGPANGTVLVETSGRGTRTADISSVGSFCLDIPLVAQSNNRVRLQAINVDGEYGPPISLDIRQEGKPPAAIEAEPVTPENMALGGAIESMSVSVSSGSAQAMIDGNPGTYAEISNAAFDDDWLIVRLRERANIDRIRVLTTEGCIIRNFRLMVTDVDSPGPAIAGGDRWDEVAHITGGQSDMDTNVEFSPRIARYLGIQILESACSHYWGYAQGYNQVREIEAWSSPIAAQPTLPPTAPSCLSGTN